MNDEQTILNELAIASSNLLKTTNPYTFKMDMMEDPLPFPIGTEPQLRLLWVAAFDAFDVVLTLHRRVAPSVLAQNRFLAEALGLVNWLVESPPDRRRRSLSFALAEVRDYQNMHSDWDRGGKRKRVIADAKKMAARIQEIADEEQLTLVAVPGERALLKGTGLSQFSYDVLSDVGSHAGIAAPLIFFAVPGENRFNMDVGNGVIPRAYYLAMGFETYGTLTRNILGALGRKEEQAVVDELIDSQAENLRRIGRLVDERAGTEPGPTGTTAPD